MHIYCFCLYPIGQHVVRRPHLPSEGAGKCSSLFGMAISPGKKFRRENGYWESFACLCLCSMCLEKCGKSLIMEYCVLIMFIRSSVSLFKSSRFLVYTLLRKYDILLHFKLGEGKALSVPIESVSYKNDNLLPHSQN